MVNYVTSLNGYLMCNLSGGFLNENVRSQKRTIIYTYAYLRYPCLYLFVFFLLLYVL